MSYHYGKGMKTAMEYGEKVSGTGFGKVKTMSNKANGGHNGKPSTDYGKNANVYESKVRKG